MTRTPASILVIGPVNPRRNFWTLLAIALVLTVIGAGAPYWYPGRDWTASGPFFFWALLAAVFAAINLRRWRRESRQLARVDVDPDVP